MADAVARLERIPERLSTFQGVNLRRDRLSLRDEDVARAINADLHTEVGVAHMRRGCTLVRALGTGFVTYLLTVGTDQYAVSGTRLYKNASHFADFSGTARVTLATQRPLNDTSTWVFIPDLALMQKESAGVLRTWGLAAPAAAPALAAGAGPGLSGIYLAKYTYVRKVGTLVAHESNPSPVSGSVTVSNQTIALTGMVASTDAQITHQRIYRTVNGGSTFLLDQEVVAGTTTATLSVADSGLGTIVEEDNDPPPLASVIVRHQEHMFLLDPAYPSYLRWSKRYRPESVPQVNFLDLGTAADPLTALVSLVGLLGVFTAKTKYRILGNVTSGFVHQEALSSRGTPAPQAAHVCDKGCLFVARDGLFLTNFVQADEELTQLIAPIFEGLTTNDYAPINWAAADTMALGYWKQRLYFSYPSGDNTEPDMLAVYSWHTSQWYFYQYSVPVTYLYNEEPTDVLLAGGSDGNVCSLETGNSDQGLPMTMTLEPATRYFGGAPAAGTLYSGAQFTRKRFDYLRVDVTGTVVCRVYIDDVLAHTVTVVGSRTRPLLRLPSLEGYTWRVTFESVSVGASVNGVEMQAVPLRSS